MSTLQTLIEKLQTHAEAIRLSSNQPLAFRLGDQIRTSGEPISSRQLLQLLKASLPEPLAVDFSWGHTLRHALEVGSELWEAEIHFTPQQEIVIDLIRRDVATPSMINPAQGQALEAVLPTPTSFGGRSEVDQQALHDLVRSGENLALIYSPLTMYQGQIKKALAQLAFEPRASTDAEVVLEALKSADFSVVALHLGVSGSDPVLGELTKMEMDRRRTIFVCLISPDVKTANALEAFSLSVDLCVAEQDLDRLERFLRKGIESRDRYVAVFHDSLRAAGKI